MRTSGYVKTAFLLKNPGQSSQSEYRGYRTSFVPTRFEKLCRLASLASERLWPDGGVVTRCFRQNKALGFTVELARKSSVPPSPQAHISCASPVVHDKLKTVVAF